MKRLLFLMMFYAGIVNAQIVNIPDANFKAKLLSANTTSNQIAQNTIGTNDYIVIDVNANGEIEQNEANLVKSLNLTSSNISSLTGIENFTSLQSLYCGNNFMTVLNITSLVNLKYLYCFNNLLTSINLPNSYSLLDFDCSRNYLTSLNCTNLVNLTGLNCDHNQFSVLDLSNSINLLVLTCNYNQIQGLDFSTNTSVYDISCTNNQLTYLNLRNGSIETIYISNNPNLQFICADDIQIANVQSLIASNGYTNCVLNTYCPIALGENHNTINGTLTFDIDNSGCDANSLVEPNIRVNINDGTITSAAYANIIGNYSFYTQAGSFTITPPAENPTYFNFSPPSATVLFSDTNNNIVTQNFCISANGIHPDLEIVIVPINRARPGFDATYNVVYHNKGNQILSGDINFTFEDAVMDYVSASIAPDSQGTGNLNWNYANLMPFETRNFTIILNINSPTETLPVNIGNQLNFSAIINPFSTDESPIDNEFSLKQIVVGSFDPNDKVCLEGDIVSPSKIGDYLHYTINFENTGTAPAENITVKDMIDIAKFDINSLQVLTASHRVTPRITDNKVEFIFENINLGASQHGNVVFKIKTKDTLMTGNTVTNDASIYFDYNEPIVTNVASTTFQVFPNEEPEIDNSITVNPNPAKSNLIINSDNIIKSMQLFDMQGRVLVTSLVNTSQFNLDVSHYSHGVYFLNIVTEKGVKTQKIIKE